MLPIDALRHSSISRCLPLERAPGLGSACGDIHPYYLTRPHLTEPTTAIAIETKSLTRRLRSGENDITVLDNVDLEIAHGEFVAVTGPSGSGKSTLLALLAGLDRPSSGTVAIDGEPLDSLDEHALALLRRRKIGFVFQSFQLLSNFTAIENVMLPLELLGTPAPRAKAAELLESVGLGSRGHHYPAQLSGGEQQRVAVARAFATDPPLLLADEPTGNLDGKNGKRVLDAMLALRRDRGTTIVMVTHDASVAGLADRTISLKDGRTVPMADETTAAV